MKTSRKRVIAGVLATMLVFAEFTSAQIRVIAKEPVQETIAVDDRTGNIADNEELVDNERIKEDELTDADKVDDSMAEGGSDTDGGENSSETGRNTDGEVAFGEDTDKDHAQDEIHDGENVADGMESNNGSDDLIHEDEEVPVPVGNTEDKLARRDVALKILGENIASGTYTNEKDGSNIIWSIDLNGKLTVEGNGNFSKDTDDVPWYSHRVDIKSAEINVEGTTNASDMFYGCSNMESVDLSNFDTSNVRYMSFMFCNCSSLISLELNSFDTGKVEKMYKMFSGCSSLTSLDLSAFDTSNVTDMTHMFYECSNLTSLNLSNFSTNNVVRMDGMFYNCSNLINLDLNSFNTNNVTRMDHMFYNCNSLTSLDLSKFNTNNVTRMDGMFGQCSNLAILDLDGFDTSSVLNMSDMFGQCSNLTSLDLSDFDTQNVTNMYAMFCGCSSLENLDISRFNTGGVTSMAGMFSGCSSLKNLDLSHFDTNSVKYMATMFSGCSSLESLNVSNFDTSNAGIMGMFLDCSELAQLDLSSFDTSNATNMQQLFEGCSSLTNLDLSSFYTGNVTNMYAMFKNCKSLTSLNLSSFDASNVTNMSVMFCGCNNLTSLDISNFDTSNVTNMYAMFENCKSLTSLNLSSFDVSNVTNMYTSFYGCSSLDTILTPRNLQCTAELPNYAGWSEDVKTDDIWYQPDGAEITELPKNLSYSIEIARNRIPGNNDKEEIASGKYQYGLSDITWTIDSNGKLTVEGTGEFAAITSSSSYFDSQYANRAPWYDYRDQIKSAEVNVEHMYDASWMFYECGNMTSVDLGNFYTSRIGNMHAMFYGCTSLKNVDLSKFDTNNVHYMSNMFWGCKSLENLDLSNFDTSQVTHMGGMFDGCSSLTSLDLSSFDTGLVSDMSWMFCGCSSLTDLNLNSFETRQVMFMADMFDGCSSLSSLDLSSFDGSSLSDIQLTWDEAIIVFDGCDNLITIYTPYGLKGSYQLPVNLGDVWYQTDGSEITELPSASGSMIIMRNKIPETSASYIRATMRKTNYVCGDFIATSGLTVKYYGSDGAVMTVTDYTTNEDEIDMSIPGKKTLVITYNGLTTDLELTVSTVLVESIELDKNELTLSVGETAQLKAEIIPFKAAEYSSVTWTSSDMSVVAVEDGLVTAVSKGECTITASAGDKEAVCNVIVTTSQSVDDIAGGTFENVRWRIDRDGKLIVEGTGDFANSNSTNRAPWFTNRTFIKSAEINLKGTTNAAYMFYGCENLVNVDLSKFDTRNVIVMDGMFEGCGSLESLNLSSFDAASVTRSVCFFDTCPKLSTIYTPYNLEQSIELPKKETSDTWYDTDGNTYTELPQNLNHSIVITKNQKPVISAPHISIKKVKTVYALGEELNIDDLTVTYYNDMGIPSTVVDYASNADEIDMSTLGAKTLIITYHDLTATIEITVTENGQVEEAIGLGISFKNAQDKESVYTGKSITPPIKVTYNGRILTEGSNYTVKYSNNIKVGTAKITVTGKGNFRSSKSEEFKIVQSDINRAELAGIDEDGSLVVASGSKFAPVIYCDGRKLTNKDYKVSGTISVGKKLLDSDNGKTITIEGKGNYTGNKEFTLKVVNKISLTKFTVSLDKNKLNSLTYDGKEHYIHDSEGAITVVGKDGNADMKRGMDYTIIYPNNVTDAGVKKFTVVGLGRYTGTVSKSYTIKPASQTAGEIKVEYEGGNVENIKLPFISTGVTFNDRLTVTYTKNGNPLVLKEGKDYKISYAGNKKVSNKAKFTISFLGNYKGNKKQTRIFTIEKGNLEDAKVIVADKVYKGKAGIYKSAPYVIEPGTNKLLPSSCYNVTFYTDEFRNVEMKGKNKVAAGDTVYVRIEAKRNGNYKTDNPIIKTYKVLEAVDLSKSKITFLDTATGVATKKTEYTGNPITDREIKVMVNGKSVDEDEDIVVTYVNNINKGKATVIITGTGETGCKYIGSKTATFNIVAYSLR